MNGRLLTGLGCAGLLAIGILLPVSAQAQDAGKKEKQGIILQLDGKQGLILLGKDKDKKERQGIILQFDGKQGLILLGKDKDKKEKQGIVIQFDGKPALIQIGKDRSPNQEVIELLQRALKIL